MVDTITEEDVQRVEGRVPADLSTEGEIEDHLNSKFDAFPEEAVDKFAEDIAEERTEESRAEQEALKDQTAVSGAGVTGKRTTMVRSADGAFFGSKSDVSNYRDRWGNVMGYNPNTGNRKKLVDSSDV